MFFTGNPSPPTIQRAKFQIDFKGNNKNEKYIYQH